MKQFAKVVGIYGGSLILAYLLTVAFGYLFGTKAYGQEMGKSLPALHFYPKAAAGGCTLYEVEYTSDGFFGGGSSVKVVFCQGGAATTSYDVRSGKNSTRTITTVGVIQSPDTPRSKEILTERQRTELEQRLAEDARNKALLKLTPEERQLFQSK